MMTVFRLSRRFVINSARSTAVVVVIRTGICRSRYALIHADVLSFISTLESRDATSRAHRRRIDHCSKSITHGRNRKKNNILKLIQITASMVYRLFLYRITRYVVFLCSLFVIRSHNKNIRVDRFVISQNLCKRYCICSMKLLFFE